MPNIITGAFLTAKVNGYNIDGNHEWSVTENADSLEGTTGADLGRGHKYFGVVDTQIKIRFYLDIRGGSANFIRATSYLTNLALYLDVTATNPMYLITSASVYRFNVAGQVRDKFIVDADIECNGPVIYYNEPN